MKSLRKIRKMGQAGRVVLPLEIRESLRIGEGSTLELWVDKDMIILNKQLPNCIFCGNNEGLKNVNGKNICGSCLKEAKELVI